MVQNMYSEKATSPKKEKRKKQKQKKRAQTTVKLVIGNYV